MAFSSLIFLNLFLPAFLLVYFLAPAKLKNPVLLIASYLFYAWGAPKVFPLLILSTAIDYYASLNFSKNQRYRKIWLWLALASNITALAYYKYANFFVGELSSAVQSLGLAEVSWVNIALPIGISFFTFQKISYLIDVWQQRAKPPQSFWQYSLFVVCFPQLIAGPIVRFHDISSQLAERKHSIEEVFLGANRFLVGLAKKVLIANPLALVVDEIFSLELSSLPAHYAWFAIICYALQIYFDFSGYSDMAIGLGRMMGFTFPENFNQPYISQNITEFWRRWHMTLSEWMKLYLYIPLGGNRISPLRTYLNLWIVFILSGLWHGAAWNFIIWGAFHGFFLICDKLFWLKISKNLPPIINICLTFTVVLFAWVLFRAESLVHAKLFMARMLAFDSFGETHSWFLWADMLNNRTILVLIVALVLSFYPAFPWKFPIKRLKQEKLALPNWGLAMSSASIILLLLSNMSLVNSHFNPFIYFRF